jgi:DNA-binding PadR family transcriptional regulator
MTSKLIEDGEVPKKVHPKRMTPKERQQYIEKWTAGYEEEVKEKGYYVMTDKNGKKNLRRKKIPPIKNDPKVEVKPNDFIIDDTPKPAPDPSIETVAKMKKKKRNPKRQYTVSKDGKATFQLWKHPRTMSGSKLSKEIRKFFIRENERTIATRVDVGTSTEDI